MSARDGVILLAEDDPNDVLLIQCAYELGANSYLVKPAGFDSLLKLVKNLDMYWLIFNEKPELDRG